MLRPIGLALRARPLHQRRLRDFLLMSRPPLLCQEGSGASNSFTPSMSARFRNGVSSFGSFFLHAPLHLRRAAASEVPHRQRKLSHRSISPVIGLRSSAKTGVTG